MKMKLRLRTMVLSAFCLAAGSVLAIPVTLDLLTDNFANETSFTMTALGDPGTNLAFVSADTDPSGNLTANETNDLADGFADLSDLEQGATDYVFEWDLMPGEYVFTIFDSFSDGICCGFGIGNYSVTTGGTTYPSPTAGDFGISEAISIRVGDVPVPATLALLGLGLAGLGWSRRRARS